MAFSFFTFIVKIVATSEGTGIQRFKVKTFLRSHSMGVNKLSEHGIWEKKDVLIGEQTMCNLVEMSSYYHPSEVVSCWF